MTRGVTNLTDRERAVALDFLLHHMTSDQRGRFMAELPTIYAKTFPSVSAEVLTGRVAERIEADRAS